jgi:hypothetical protein
VVVKPYVRVPEAQRKPIIQPHHMPAASGFSHHNRDVVRPPHAQPRSHAQPRQFHGSFRSQAGSGAGFRSQGGGGGSGFRGRG